MTWRSSGFFFGLLLFSWLPACGEAVDERGASRLWDDIHADDYRDWARPPGWEARMPTLRAHGETADIFINDVMTDALTQSGLEAWPQGALLVKDSYDGDALALIAAMEKRADGWFFAEWDADGSVKFAGTPAVCTSCHDAGNDSVLAVGLP